MKKVLFLFLALAACTTMALADHHSTPIQVAQMPEMAQTFIQRHFNDVQVRYAKQQYQPAREYEVVLVNGTKLEFDANGNWTEVDCKYGVVPDEIVPQPLRDYVEKNYPDQRIVDIEQGRRGYKLELDNGLDLKFNKEYRLVDMDD